jgi:glucosylceramidase
MKTNQSLIGGSLKQEFEQVYAVYLAKYITEMQQNGVTIDYLSIQNEPMNGHNNPSMLMNAGQMKRVIAYLHTELKKNKENQTKLVIWDHNCDVPEYPLSILNDNEINPYVNAVAFHLHAGKINILSDIHSQHPDKAIFFTEQWTSADGNAEQDFLWHLKNVVIGSLSNWSEMVLLWNLAADEQEKPHTEGGCSNCLGAITIQNGDYEKNVAYRIIQQVSPFFLSDSKRIEITTSSTTIISVAFERTDGKIALLIVNDQSTFREFTVYDSEEYGTLRIPGKSAATILW